MEVTSNGVFILTGATGALAEAIAEVFGDAGARLVLTGRDESDLKARAERFRATAVPADLTRIQDAERVVAEALRAHGRVDGMIHSAGGFAMSPAHKTEIGEYERMMDVNMRTLFCAARAVLPALIAQKDGFIAGISSAIVQTGEGAGMSTYAASKGALTSYLRAIAAETRSSGVRVAIAYPEGPIDTPANRASMPGQDPSGWVDPLEIARALLFAGTRGPRGDLTELSLGVRR